MNSVSKLLSTDGYIQVNKALIKELGLHESILIGELCSEYNYWESKNKLVDNMFFSTRENIENNTGLNEHYQRKALKTLKEKGIITVERKGLPAVNFYKIDFDKILSILTSRCSQDEELETNPMHLNNNKENKINKQENNSKELLQDFNFGKTKQKPKKDSLFTKCVMLIDSYDIANFGNIRHLLIEYLNYRLSVKDKPLYTNMWKGMLNKLCELGQDDVLLYEDIIKQSIERGYLSFYPVKNFASTQSKPWEEDVNSSAYSEDELMQLDILNEERERKGLRTKF